MAEAGAKAAVAALKDATLIKSKKADWRLVAAAQAMLFALTDTRPLDWLMKSDPYDAHLSSSLLAT